MCKVVYNALQETNFAKVVDHQSKHKTNNRQEEGRVHQSNNQENKVDPVAYTEYASQVRWQDIAMNGIIFSH